MFEILLALIILALGSAFFVDAQVARERASKDGKKPENLV